MTRLRLKRCLRWIRREITPQEIANFSRQLAYFLKSRFPLTIALDMLANQVGSVAMQSLIMNLKRGLEAGVAFSVLLKKYPRYFNTLYCHVVGVSEVCSGLEVQLLYLERTIKRSC